MIFGIVDELPSSSQTKNVCGKRAFVSIPTMFKSALSFATESSFFTQALRTTTLCQNCFRC